MLLIMDARAVRPYKVIGTGSSTLDIENTSQRKIWPYGSMVKKQRSQPEKNMWFRGVIARCLGFFL